MKWATQHREFMSAEEAERWAQENYKAIYNEANVSSADFDLLFAYSGSWYALYNSHLRYGEEYGEETTREIDSLTALLDRCELPENVVAYRYTTKDVIKAMCQNNVQVGAVFSDKAFFSTSLVRSSMEKFRRENKCNCLLKLYLPKGLNGVYIPVERTNSQLREQELLLQRDTLFEIVKVHHLSWPLLIECRAIKNTFKELGA